MKKQFLFTLLFLSFAMAISAQNVGYSRVGSLNITKTFVPPVFQVVGDLVFDEQNSDKAVNANEQCAVVMKVKNIGKGAGEDLNATMSVTGSTSGISYKSSLSVPDIAAGETATIRFPFSASRQTVDGSITVTVKLNEPHKLGTRPLSITVTTRKFDPPAVQYVDHQVVCNNGTIRSGIPFDLVVLVQNLGHSDASNVRVALDLPANIIAYSGNTEASVAELASGQDIRLRCGLIANENYTSSTIPVKVRISEQYGQYAKPGQFAIPMNQAIQQRELVVQAVDKPREAVVASSLHSDVDRNIPKTSVVDSKTHVFIIANSGYQNEPKLATAVNDAISVRDYCVSTLGIPAANVELLLDRTAAQMQSDIENMVRTMKYNSGHRFLFFYFGHGCASLDQQDAYLIAVDGSTKNSDLARSGISRQAMLKRFESAAPQQMVVFLESCFSGFSATDEQLAYAVGTSGTRLSDKVTDFGGNILLLSACSSQQTANAYPAEGHNLFTYCFLKELQQTAGNTTWGSLYRNVAYQTDKLANDKLGHKVQTPTFKASENLPDQAWRQWPLLLQ